MVDQILPLQLWCGARALWDEIGCSREGCLRIELEHVMLQLAMSFAALVASYEDQQRHSSQQRDQRTVVHHHHHTVRVVVARNDQMSVVEEDAVEVVVADVEEVEHNHLRHHKQVELVVEVLMHGLVSHTCHRQRKQALLALVVVVWFDGLVVSQKQARHHTVVLVMEQDETNEEQVSHRAVHRHRKAQSQKELEHEVVFVMVFEEVNHQSWVRLARIEVVALVELTSHEMVGKVVEC